jgi:hypothetical protein
MTRIAIITEDDDIWALYAWERAIPLLLSQGYVITGVWACPTILSGMRGMDIYVWYLKTFGAYTFIKLAIFAFIIKFTRKIIRYTPNQVRNIRQLAKSFEIPFTSCSSPNAIDFINEIKLNKVDILLIMVSFILKKEVLDSVTTGVINKHASLLPSNRGLFPYIWAIVDDVPQGVSYHKTVPGIDQGPILYQESDIPKACIESMISYYFYVFHEFPKNIVRAVNALNMKQEVSPHGNVLPSYHGLPKTEDMKIFFSKGGKIILIKDLLLAFKMNGLEK